MESVKLLLFLQGICCPHLMSKNLLINGLLYLRWIFSLAYIYAYIHTYILVYKHVHTSGHTSCVYMHLYTHTYIRVLFKHKQMVCTAIKFQIIITHYKYMLNELRIWEKIPNKSMYIIRQIGILYILCVWVSISVLWGILNNGLTMKAKSCIKAPIFMTLVSTLGAEEAPSSSI